jgi:hypothetical protein
MVALAGAKRFRSGIATGKRASTNHPLVPKLQLGNGHWAAKLSFEKVMFANDVAIGRSGASKTSAFPSWSLGTRGVNEDSGYAL